MMSLSQLRSNLFATFALMRDTGVSIDVYHRRRVYKLTIVPTNERVTKPYKPRKDRKIVPPAMITDDICPSCHSLIISGICMNRVCITNQKTA